MVGIPTCEEAVGWPLAEGPPTPPAYPAEESPKDCASGDALRGTQPHPPPSYESIISAVNGLSGETVPATACSCPGPAQTTVGGGTLQSWRQMSF